MNFTPELPTEPGIYLWKSEPDTTGVPTAIYRSGPELVLTYRGQEKGMPLCTVANIGGLWCKLEPEKQKCIWTKRPHDTLFKTACGVHKFLDPGSNEPASDFYCSHCGGRIEVQT